MWPVAPDRATYRLRPSGSAVRSRIAFPSDQLNLEDLIWPAVCDGPVREGSKQASAEAATGLYEHMQYLQLGMFGSRPSPPPLETTGAYSWPMSIQDVGSGHTIPVSHDPVNAL